MVLLFVAAPSRSGSVTLLQPKVVQTTQQHVSYEFVWIRRTSDYIYLNVHCFVLFSSIWLGLGLALGLDLESGW